MRDVYEEIARLHGRLSLEYKKLAGAKIPKSEFAGTGAKANSKPLTEDDSTPQGTPALGRDGKPKRWYRLWLKKPVGKPRFERIRARIVSKYPKCGPDMEAYIGHGSGKSKAVVAIDLCTTGMDMAQHTADNLIWVRNIPDRVRSRVVKVELLPE